MEQQQWVLHQHFKSEIFDHGSSLIFGFHGNIIEIS
jgi:hypothetical protein